MYITVQHNVCYFVVAVTYRTHVVRRYSSLFFVQYTYYVDYMYHQRRIMLIHLHFQQPSLLVLAAKQFSPSVDHKRC